MDIINEYLQHMIETDASDIYFTVGVPASFRIEGIVTPYGDRSLGPEDTQSLAYSIMNDRQKKKFEEEMEMNLAIYRPEYGRFRVNIFRQKSFVGVVIRQIKMSIKTIDDWGLPAIMKDISMSKRGLVLVVGATGSGKSTTLAAMIDYRNSNQRGHIITIEDPIEFVHEDKKSIVDQREIGSDTSTFSSALRVALRQDPDVILVGEMRDFETIETALTAAETGHLVMSTLHTLNATETITRIISVFPPYHQKQVRLQLSGVLKGVISQRLVPRADGMGRVPAVEVLVSTARVRECIVEKDKTNEINDAISRGVTSYGMQSFDQSLMFLMKEALVTYDEALKHCTNPDDFALRVKGILAASDAGWEDFELLEKEKETVKERAKAEEKKLKAEKPADAKVNDRRGTGLKQ